MKGRIVHGQPPQCLPPEMEWQKVQDLRKVTDDPGIQIEGFSENVHNWTKRSIFWDLSYWQHQLLRHNLDVMHIEKNFCENIVNTVMDVPDKSKDNANARLDIEEMCAREEYIFVLGKMETHTSLKRSLHYLYNREDRSVNGYVV